MDSHYAATIAYDRKVLVQCRKQGSQLGISKERLINWGFCDIATAYQSLHQLLKAPDTRTVCPVL